MSSLLELSSRIEARLNAIYARHVALGTTHAIDSDSEYQELLRELYDVLDAASPDTGPDVGLDDSAD